MPDIEREDACTCGTLCATHWATCPLGEPLDGGAVTPDIERSSADWYARRAAKWEETAGVMPPMGHINEAIAELDRIGDEDLGTAVKDLWAEAERFREANEHLLALENGDWRARYSDASREVEQLRDENARLAHLDYENAGLDAEVARLRDLVDRADPCVVAALNCPAHPWHGADVARKWLVESYA